MTDKIITSTLEVRKDSLGAIRVVEDGLGTQLAENQVLFKVGRLALTANNISYATTGDSLGYWGFFPAEEGWGRIPAMGWGEVIASEHPEVSVGERFWGWFPISTHLKISLRLAQMPSRAATPTTARLLGSMRPGQASPRRSRRRATSLSQGTTS